MKKIFFLITVCLLSAVSMQAKSKKVQDQVQKDSCQLPVMVVIPQGQNLSAASETKLQQKVILGLTQNGMLGDGKYSPFSVTATITENSKELTSGARPLTTVIMDLTLVAGNTATGEKFYSQLFSLKGAGKTQDKAVQAAISSLSGQMKEMKTFTSEARNRIFSYYNFHAQALVANARSLAQRKKYEEALYILAPIPQCINNFPIVEEAMRNIYQQYINQQSENAYMMALTTWQATQDKETALSICKLLVKVDPQSSSYDKALDLLKEIGRKVGEDAEYQRAQKEMQDARKQEKELASIEAMRQIGIAYGENQQQTIINEKH